MKSPQHVVPMLVALTLALVLSGCSKKTTPTGLDTVDPVGTLDTAPAAMPTQIAADLDVVGGNATIEWTPSSSASVSHYEIAQYKPCPQSESAYVVVASTDAATTSYQVPWPTQQTTLYYRLRTASTAGVRSGWSDPIEVTVGPGVGGPADPEGIKER